MGEGAQGAPSPTLEHSTVGIAAPTGLACRTVPRTAKVGGFSVCALNRPSGAYLLPSQLAKQGYALAPEVHDEILRIGER